MPFDITAESILNKNIAKEMVNITIGTNGQYSKMLKILTINEITGELMIDIRLNYNGVVTACGVTLTVEEFLQYLEAITNINSKTQRVKQRQFKPNQRDWQIYTHETYSAIWYLALQDKDGVESSIGLPIKEMKTIRGLKDYVIAECKKYSPTLMRKLELQGAMDEKLEVENVKISFPSLK
jgi:hypothetical protein